MTDIPSQSLVENIVVLRCQMGDQSAFEQLLRDYYPQLRRFVQRLLGSDDKVADILQEVWLTVFRKIFDLKEPSSFKPWVYAITRNQAYKAAPKNGKHVSLDDPEVPEAADNGSSLAGPETSEIHKYMDQIPAKQREVLILRFLDEMDYQQIAQVIGSSIGTVRSRIHYGKKSLRRIMEANDHGY